MYRLWRGILPFVYLWVSVELRVNSKVAFIGLRVSVRCALRNTFINHTDYKRSCGMNKLIFIVGLLVSTQCFAFDLGGVIDRVSENFDRKTEKLVEETANETTDSLLGVEEAGEAEISRDRRRSESGVSSMRVAHTPSKRDSLRELKELKDEGLISESEYAEGRKEILARP